MSAQPMEQPLAHPVTGSMTPIGPPVDEPDRTVVGSDDPHGEGGTDTVPTSAVEVRRNAAVSAAVGVAGAAVAIAYLWRAVGSGSLLDWVLCAATAAIAVVFLRSLFDARTPLLVADELGVRIRLAEHWRGLPWDAIENVVVKPRRGILHDGRLLIRLHHAERAVEGLERRARRHAEVNQRLYGSPLAVPLGLTTRVGGGAGRDLAGRVASLSQGRAEVVTLLDRRGRPATQELDQPFEGDVVDAAVTPAAVEEEVPDATAQRAPDRDPAAGVALRRLGEVTSAVTSAVSEAVGEVVTEAVAPVADRDARGAKVRALARLGDPVAPLVIDDFQPEPAYDPVIGPELSAARTRVGLSVDELADRTRIRPHVIESIEVDDFAACGGDFYARGHIRTLARVLGKDPGPLMALFEERYASAPVNARRVFEAELATGMTGGARRNVGGPNWALLVGAVLALVLVWSVVRLFSTEGQEVLQPAPMLNGSEGIGQPIDPPAALAQPSAPKPLVTVVTAVNGGTHVEVRDGDGALVFGGDLVLGEAKRVRVDPPVTVSADDGAAVSVTVAGRDMGVLGQPAQPGTRTFQRPSR